VSDGPKVAVADDKLMSLDERQYLWDIEHLGFVLEQKVFPSIKKAIAAWDHAALAAWLDAEFTGTLPGELWDDHIERAPIEVREVTLASGQQQQVTAAAFLETLAAYRRLLDPQPERCSVSIGLVHLGPNERGNLDGTWHSVWKIRMAGKQDQRMVEVNLNVAVEISRLDESIPERQHWIRTGRLDKAQLVASDRPLMQEVTLDSGFDQLLPHDNWLTKKFIVTTGGIYLADYDQDGNLDALLTDVNTGATLYRGLGNGKFQDVTTAAGLPRTTAENRPLWTTACWADFDGDADEDLIFEGYLWENLGNGRFQDVTAKTNLRLAPSAGYAVGDYDLDGKVDLYVCHTGKYMLGQVENHVTPWIDGGLGIDNVLWRNKGHWQFEDVTYETNTGGGGMSCFAAVWFHANDDLRPDLLAINEFGRNSLLINQPDGRFTGGCIDPIFGGFSMGVTTGDVNNDGRTDVYVANMYSKAGNRIFANVDTKKYPPELWQKVYEGVQGSKLYLSRGDGTFEVLKNNDQVAQLGWAYGTNCFDLDGDGLLEIYAAGGFKSIERGKPDG
jgi:hypothetical protein